MEDEIPLIAMEKLLKKAGAKRVSESSKQTLRKVLVERAVHVAKKAIVLSKHANRLTVKGEDIDLALES